MNDPGTTGRPERSWWKEAVVYQIYPRSFNDTDGDGVGDLPGVVGKVEYLDALGVDVVWLCPVYDSPHADNGYDIRDYRSIHSEYGTMDDWERLRDELHARDMRLIMDLVVNHTSKEHDWFRRSRRREGKYEDYYYWRDGRPAEDADYDTADGPADEVAPNNWDSIFGGPAWTYDEARRQWYLHLFDENQPDLNWRTYDVREDIEEMMTWWLEKGIDGFRMDAINFLSKTEGLPDGDPQRELAGAEHFSHGPRIHEYLQEVHDEVLSNYDVMTVGEMGVTTVDQAADYLGDGGGGLQMVFQFNHLGVDQGPNGPWSLDDWGEWDLTEFKEIVTRCQNVLCSEWWDALFLGNHDLPRIVSRFGDDDAYREESATLIATFLLTMRGTPYIYQGEEIGMTNAVFESLDEIDDPKTIGIVESFLAEGVIDSYQEVADLVNYQSRDHARTPMQWSDDENAGFTDGDPWLEVNPNYESINVENAVADETSIWHHYRRLIGLRNEEDVLVYGEYRLLCPADEQIYAYTRTLEEDRILVALNWSSEIARFDADVETTDPTILYGNYDDPRVVSDTADLRPYEAVVYRL